MGKRRKQLPGWRRRRGESREGVLFRRHLLTEEAADRAADALGLISVLSLSGVDPTALDWEALRKISRPVGTGVVDGVPVVIIEPIDQQQDPDLFDRQVRDAGLSSYIREPFPGEMIG
jgi:hypothetical protein